MRFPASARATSAGPDGAITFALVLDPGLLGFQGHFPGNPILPGVVQVDWAIHFGLEAFGALGPFQGVEHLKFMEVIRPGEDLTLTLALDAARENLKFSYQGGGVRKASGILRFRGDA